MAAFNDILSDPVLRGLVQWVTLAFVRLLPIATFTPLLGGRFVPARVRFGAAAVLALIVFSVVQPTHTPALPPDAFLLLMLKEAALGGVIAVIVRLGFELLGVFGQVADQARMDTLSGGGDALRGEPASALSRLMYLGGFTLFLSAGGAELLIGAVVGSFFSVPPTALGTGDILTADRAGALLHLAQAMLATAVVLAAPVLAVLALVDALFAVVSRVSPQTPVFFLSMGVKPLLGLGAVLLAVAVAGTAVQDWVAGVGRAFTDATGAGLLPGGTR